MLRTYATPTAMREALDILRSVRQTSEEDEGSYEKRLNHDVQLCGNFHEVNEKIIFYIDVHLPTTRTIVAHFRESEPSRDLTFKDITHFARAQVEAIRALRISTSIREIITTPLVRLLQDGTRRSKSTISRIDKPLISRIVS